MLGKWVSILLWGALANWLGAQQVSAQQSNSDVSRWYTNLTKLDCDAALFDNRDQLHEHLWLYAGAFGGLSLRETMLNAQYSSQDADFLLEKRVVSFGNREDILERILKLNPEISERMVNAVAAYGAALCPILRHIRDRGFEETVRNQEERRSYWQPHSGLAQLGLSAKGCGPLEIDGLFGPGSRAIWQGLGLGLSAGNLPTPGDLVALAQSPALCTSTKRVDLAALYELCSSAFVDYDRRPALFADVNDILSGLPADDRLLERADPILQCVLKHQNVGFWEGSGPLEDLIQNEIYGSVLQVLTRLPLADTADWQSLQEYARYLVARLSPTEQFEEGTGTISRPQLAAMARFLLLATEEPLRQALGFALLLETGEGVPLADLETVFAMSLPFPELKVEADRLIERSLTAVNNNLFQVDWETGEPLHIARGTLVLDTHLTIGFASEFLSNFQTIASNDLLYDALMNGPYPQLHYAFGSLLMEGLSDEGRDPQRAAKHFLVAAQNAHVPSTLRLSLMYRFGLGVNLDVDEAQSLLVVAAEKGDPTAMLELALQAETGEGGARDWEKAAAYYRQALYRIEPSAAARVVFGRMLALTGFWESGELGDGLLRDIILQALQAAPQDIDQDDDRERAIKQANSREIAMELGALFSDATSAQALDLAQAAQWMRVADEARIAWRVEDPETQYFYDRLGVTERLGDILRLNPELAAHPMESELLSAKGGETNWFELPDTEKALEGMRQLCRLGDLSNEGACLDGLKEAALGFYAPELIAPAFDHLMTLSEEELRRLSQPVSLDVDEVDKWRLQSRIRNRTKYTIRLVDVLAFYGEYVDAERRARLARNAQVSASLGPLRRQVARAIETGVTIDGLEALLVTLSRQGEAPARNLLAVLRGQVSQRAQTKDIAAARMQHDAVLHMPHSQALSSSARRLAALVARDEDTVAAVELEMIALSADLERNRVDSTSTGPIGWAMADVCSLSRASERLVNYEAPEAALVLAKRAVNRLQATRSLLSSLPEQVQLCFRAQVENHYRWLADLMMSQGRPQEASRVLEMLKDFESFEFASRSQALAGDAYDRLPFSTAEQVLISALFSAQAPAPETLTRLRRLQNLAQVRPLRVEELEELTQMQTGLQAYNAEAEGLRQAIIAGAVAVTELGEQPGFSPNQLMDRYLAHGESSQTAILQYVVLQDRFGLILSTQEGQHVWQWDQLEGEAFAEAALDGMVASFRGDVFNQNRDPRPMGQRLYDLLLPEEVTQVLQAQETTSLVLSLDRHLRYLPMAALYDEGQWLTQKYRLSHVTAGTAAEGVLPRSSLIAGFGATKALQGLPALPAVETEVKAVVQESPDDNGFISGTALFDQDFNRDSLVAALRFGDADGQQTGVLHLASHFKISNTEATSALLLGNGDFLSVQDLREGMGQNADLSQVSLLTLSACETGFGSVDADGRELESVAAIAQERGAQAVLASVLPVPDGATAALMVGFYRAYSEGEASARALQTAQLAIISGEVDTDTELDRGAMQLGTLASSAGSSGSTSELGGWTHPRFWASFILLEGSL